MKKDQIIILKELLKKGVIDFNYHYNFVNQIIDLDSKVLDILKDNISSNNLFYGIKVALCDDLKKEDNYYELISQVLTFPNSVNVYEAVNILTNNNLINDPFRLSYFNKALTTKIDDDEIKEGLSKVSCYRLYLTNDNTKNDTDRNIISEKIINSNKLFNASSMKKVATSKHLMNSSKRMEIIDKLSTCEKEYQAKYATLFINNNDDDSNLIEIVDKILSCKEEYQAKAIYQTAFIILIRKSKNCLNVIDLMSRITNEEQGKAMLDIAKISYFIDKEDYLTILESFLECKDSKEIRIRLKEIKDYLKKYDDVYSEIAINTIEELMEHSYKTNNYSYALRVLENLDLTEFDKNTKLHIRIRKKI